jgi:probable rRNA maturation factor
MISVDFLEIEPIPELEKTSEKAVLACLRDKEGDVSIVFCDNAYIQALNAQFRGIDRPTDVLSFPAEETDPDSGVRYLGDVIISYPQACAQAKEAGNLVNSEISMLVIHGILHLLGYDHQTPEEKAEMWKLQTETLNSLGIHMDKFTGDE